MNFVVFVVVGYNSIVCLKTKVDSYFIYFAFCLDLALFIFVLFFIFFSLYIIFSFNFFSHIVAMRKKRHCFFSKFIIVK